MTNQPNVFELSESAWDLKLEMTAEVSVTGLAEEAAKGLPGAMIQSNQGPAGTEINFRISLEDMSRGSKTILDLPVPATALRFTIADLPPPQKERPLPNQEKLSVTILPDNLPLTLQTALVRQLEGALLHGTMLHRKETNLITRLITYLYGRRKDLIEYCVSCDSKLPFWNLPLLSVCRSEFCRLKYAELGLDEDIVGRAVEAAVLDLLVVLFRACAGSNRRHLLLDPWPTVADPAQPNILGLHPATAEVEGADKLLLDTLAGIPCPCTLFREGFRPSKVEQGLSFHLFRWLFTSNRTTLFALPEEERLDFLPTRHQFIMLTDNPDKETAFQHAKQDCGGKTVFAFHGSPLSNWHSILRKGLVVGSATEYKMNGAVHGDGIYLSQNAYMALTYSDRNLVDQRGTVEVETFDNVRVACSNSENQRPACGEGRFLGDPYGLICMAICEVVDSPALKRASDAIWVASDPEHVATRFLVLLRADGNVIPALKVHELNLARPQTTLALDKAMTYRENHLN